MTLNQNERSEAETALRERISFLSDSQLTQILKSTHEPSGNELREDIEKFSKNIR